MAIDVKTPTDLADVTTESFEAAPELSEGLDAPADAVAETTETVNEAAAETTENLNEVVAETTEAVNEPVQAVAETTETVNEAAAETTENLNEVVAETTEVVDEQVRGRCGDNRDGERHRHGDDRELERAVDAVANAAETTENSNEPVDAWRTPVRR